MNITLLFPPHWTPAMPHLALPVLTGWLRRHGHRVTQRDLNVEAFDEILTHHHLVRALDQIRRRFGAPTLSVDRPSAEQVAWALEQGPQIARQIEQAKAVLRSPAFYDGEASQAPFLTVAIALELVSLAHYPSRLDLTRFNGPGRPDSSRDLLLAARDPHTNPFYDIFRRGVIRDLQRERPDLVGISVPTEGQFLAGLTLAALIRDAGLKCHITMGGPHISMLREQVQRVPALFDLIDSFVVFEGEIPLLRLVEALASDGNLANVPNLIYRQPAPGKDIRTNPVLEQLEVRSALLEQAPDFEGLSLERYLVPEPVLPLITAHGCYYGRCGFCNVGYGNPFEYYPYPVERVIDQMHALQQKYGCRHIFFVDEAVTMRSMRLISAALSAEGSDLNWTGAARLEKSLTPQLLGEIARGGCRMLLFGLESASEPNMLRMVKGTTKEEMSRVLREGAAAGIWNHAFFFFGFPGETIAEAQETVNFIYEHQDAIHSASPGTFVLERYSPAHREQKKYGVRRVSEQAERDLAIYFDYEPESGMDAEVSNNLIERLMDQLPEKRYGLYYINDVFKFLYASELHRRGQPLPWWIE
jgi:anaerobic magnesium-protoporphyrin IX monomethyl ester cyclase